jgi:hypothetical protein
MSCLSLSCFAILNLDLCLPPRGLVLNFELQQGHRTPPSHFINIWHTWQRFCPSRYLLKLALGFCILWRKHIPLHGNFFITSDNVTTIREQEHYCSFGAWHNNMEHSCLMLSLLASIMINNRHRFLANQLATWQRFRPDWITNTIYQTFNVCFSLQFVKAMLNNLLLAF